MCARAISTGAMDEDNLIAAAQQGDVDAFNQLVLNYQQMAYNVAYRVIGNQNAAEDATQEAFLKAYRALDQFRGGSFKSWLLRITTNCCYDILRHKQRRPSSPIDDLVENEEHTTLLQADEEEPDDYLERQQLGELIQAGIQTLPEDQRIVVVMSDIEGLSYSEIAEATNVALGTVKSRLSRARAKLRDYLMERRELFPDGFRPSGES